ncbi:SDR family NAD(P)-dependent oxidoreductase [Saccharothrix deserti]|uniref:SDR family NAD(P)-dependent oxidoreductase n=1 Tax=Saccharothrix deserti TaxID=2593674 RepID=UPI00131E2DDD|nr:SDR family oxidoreductase [Saccharothrix deserti]
MTRTAVVTGGGTGIGRAIAEELVARGLDVVITGRREDVLEQAADEIGARAVAFDAADPEAVDAAREHLPERVDVLVNNAGGLVGGDDLKRQWLAMYEANVVTAVLVTTALQPRLAENARVVTIGSIAGRRGGGSYGAAKAAVEAWTAELAFKLGGRGITANVVAPGFIEDTEFFGGDMSEQRRSTLVAQTANGRAGTPADVAATVAFLTSPEAGHITGQVVAVNGGAHLGR